VWFVDSRTTALWRVLLPALSERNVYDYRAARVPTYVAAYDAAVAVLASPVRVLSDLLTPVGFSMDLDSLVGASAGAVSIATDADASSYSEDNADSGTVGRAFVSLLEGRVLRFDTTLLLSPSEQLPASIDGSVARTAYGLQEVLNTPSKARLGGLAVVPMVPSPTNWTQHRCFVADANQQALYAATEWPGGAPSAHNTVDLSVFDRENVLFPVQVAVRPVNVTADVVDLYVAEYLGKIWRVRIPRDGASDSAGSGSGTIDVLGWEQGEALGGPVGVLDASAFPASTRVRRYVEDATSDGSAVHQKLTFEGLQ
jgi:hypothetical protein